jgi:uncharacterized membrane protein/glutaredoxin
VIRVRLYTRDECPLCEKAKRQLDELAEGNRFELVEVDIEQDTELLRRYGKTIPVVQVGPYTLEAPFTQLDLQVAISAARDGGHAPPEHGEETRSRAIRINRGVLFFARHWLGLFNLLVLLYVGIPFAAPALMQAGAAMPAKWIYKLYSPLCHQYAFRSWFLFGEDPAYPLERANSPYTSYETATGLPSDDYASARSFIGNGQVGYKVALCERDVAIYGGILVAGLLFALVRRRLRPLPIPLWFVFGILPIAVDGISQLFAGAPLPLLSQIPARESTPALRTVTGFLFGLTNVLMAYPYVEESMQDTRVLLVSKLAAVRDRKDAAVEEPGAA